jgi:hypothetical protein
LLMATFVVVSALPAVAAPPDVDYRCIDANGNQIFMTGSGEVPRQGETARLKKNCIERGGDELIVTLTPESGKPGETPPSFVAHPNR